VDAFKRKWESAGADKPFIQFVSIEEHIHPNNQNETGQTRAPD